MKTAKIQVLNLRDVSSDQSAKDRFPDYLSLIQTVKVTFLHQLNQVQKLNSHQDLPLQLVLTVFR